MQSANRTGSRANRTGSRAKRTGSAGSREPYWLAPPTVPLGAEPCGPAGSLGAAPVGSPGRTVLFFMPSFIEILPADHVVST